MNKKEIIEIKKQVLMAIMKIEKETFAASVNKTDGTEEFTQTEAVNMGKLLIIPDIIKSVENVFKDLE